MPKVLVGISGGVDSSVTALLLRNQGFEVEGVLLKQVNEPTDCDDYVCCSETAIARARSVCDHLNIRLHTPDVRKQFSDKIINPSIRLWEDGGVPSPCTSCNADFRAPLLNYYRQVLGCDFFATGHYFINNSGQVSRGTDPTKDQSYMIGLVQLELLKFWLTPLGDLTKARVRQIAAQNDIATANTPDSQNLCFNHLLPPLVRPVLQHSEKGLFKIGTHSGRPAIGQRKGFGGRTVISVSDRCIIVGDVRPQSKTINVMWKNYPSRNPNELNAQVAYHGKKYGVSSFDARSITLDSEVVVNT